MNSRNNFREDLGSKLQQTPINSKKAGHVIFSGKVEFGSKVLHVPAVTTKGHFLMLNAAVDSGYRRA